jgi:hypothetical protein
MAAPQRGGPLVEQVGQRTPQAANTVEDSQGHYHDETLFACDRNHYQD